MSKSSQEPGKANGYGISALSDGLHILQTVAQRPDLKVPQLAAQAGMTKSKVYRILRTLEGLGYIWYADDHSVRLGSAALLLGHHAEEQYWLTQAARTVLNDLAAQTQENVYLIVREGLLSHIVDLRMSPRTVRMYAKIGQVGRLHAGGASKVLLAYAPHDVVEAVLNKPLEQFTPSTVQRPEDLRQILAEIRRDGYHVTVGDLEDQVFAVAAPIFDRQGQVLAALSVAGPLMRFDAERQQHYVTLVQRGSQTISQRLGGTMPRGVG